MKYFDATPGVSRLQHSTATNAVMEVLRDAILDGRFPAGMQLREAHLAAELGISRAPVREAISQLVEAKLAVKVPYKGATVIDISASAIADIAAVRKLVETPAMEAAIASEALDLRPLLDETLAIMSRAAADSLVSQSVIAHMEFHRLFYAHCGNAMLYNMWRSWEGQLQLFFSKDHTVFADLGSVTQEHNQLLSVAYSKDHQALRREVGRHVHGSVDPSHWHHNPPGSDSSPLPT